MPSGDPLIDHLSGRKLAALISLYRYPLWTDDMRTLFHQWLFNSPTGGMSGGCDRRRSPRARDDGQGIRRERDPAGRLGQARCLGGTQQYSARHECYNECVAISPKMLAVLQKVEAAREQHFADLRASAKRDAKEKARVKALAKDRSQTPKRRS